jgi:hypothetical protein
MSWTVRGFLAALKSSRRQPLRKTRLALKELEARLAPAVNVLHFHYDNASTGVNVNETRLSTANVKVGSFDRLSTTLKGR